MANELRVTYKKALMAAFNQWREFYDKNAHYEAVKDERTQHWCEWQLHELRCIAHGSCAAEWMLCDMFGLSEERVHNDLMAIWHQERAKEA